MAAVDDVLNGLGQLPDFLAAARNLVAEQNQTLISLQGRVVDLVGEMRAAQEAARNELAAARSSLQGALDAKEAERAQAVAAAAVAVGEAQQMADHPDVKAARLAALKQQAETLDAHRFELAKAIAAASSSETSPS